MRSETNVAISAMTMLTGNRFATMSVTSSCDRME